MQPAQLLRSAVIVTILADFSRTATQILTEVSTNFWPTWKPRVITHRKRPVFRSNHHSIRGTHLGSARASRAGDDALVIAHFFLCRGMQPLVPCQLGFGEAPKPAGEAACAPQNTARPASRSSDTAHEFTDSRYIDNLNSGWRIFNRPNQRVEHLADGDQAKAAR
jgi:hypothetical protein